MVTNIRGVKVVGIIDTEGKCPCGGMIIVNNSNYKFIRGRSTVEFNNGEIYIKCSRCGKFVMRPKRAA